MSKDFIKTEHEVLEFWEKNNCFQKLIEKNKGNMPFRFLDGPITANNSMGIHHAWGRSIKDIILRYKAMNGFSCHYRNGFDTQGLWVEVEVEKDLGFRGKKDIENYGMDRFTQKCEERIKHFSGKITEQSQRLGQWMDWDNSYYTHSDENITSIWYFLKVCGDNGWITRASRPMQWCPRCGTSLSEHEMTGSYRKLTHTAVFAKLPVKNRDFDILVWTTTPWTLCANVALAINPELEYALVKLNNSEKLLVVAKAAIKHIEEDKKVVKIFKGSELTGLEYETFFPFLSVQNFTHKIIPWADVQADEGSGVVHIAPGCGTEDYELGKRFGLTSICPIDENGRFTEEYDFLKGILASDVRQLVFDRLSSEGKLFKTHEYTHSYPVCWRCKTEVVFRLVEEWYIKTDEIKPKLLEASSKVKWEPEYIGKRMNDWLLNMGDWNISRKRYYGLPLPFYPCENCGHVTIIGSKEELRSLGGVAVDNLKELHRPWIDEIKIKCPKCGSMVSRIPEVGDVWLDAGITPFSTLKYFSDKEYWEKNFPAQWVTEMREQVRLWFYSLLFMSVTLTGRAPYERVLAYSSVVAEDGTKFSKTGFMIKFDEAAEKTGADSIRYLFAGANTSSDVRFGFNLGDEAKRKLLGFKNIVSFFKTYAQLDKPLVNSDVRLSNLTDLWLKSRINDFLSNAVKYYEDYNTVGVVKEFEQCIDDVSNWYIRVNRKRFWKDILDSDKLSAYEVLYFGIKTITQVMAPIVPFMTEDIWQNVIKKYDPASELSVHLSSFPNADKIDSDILIETENVRKIINLGLKLRNEVQIKVKQPLSRLYLSGENIEKVIMSYGDILKDELNVKEIVLLANFDCLRHEYLVLNFKTAGRALRDKLQNVKEKLSELSDEEMKECVTEFYSTGKIRLPQINESLSADLFIVQTRYNKDICHIEDTISVALLTDITTELRNEGIFRELLRACQVLRKEAGFEVSDKVNIELLTDSKNIIRIVELYRDTLEKETLSKIVTLEDSVYSREVTVGSDTVILRIAASIPGKNHETE